MANRGGVAGGRGYSYQYWFIAYQLGKMFFDQSMKIQAEANVVYSNADQENSKQNSASRNFIDDLIIYKKNEITSYNIKYIAPSETKWTSGRLSNQGVISQIKNQYKNNPSVKITFVSQSPCPLFSSIFPQLCECNSLKEIKLRVSAQSDFAELEKFKHYIGLNYEEIIELSKLVRFKRGYEQDEYINLIGNLFKGRITNESGIAYYLYQLAKDIGGRGIVDQEYLKKMLEKEGFCLLSSIDFSEIKKEFDNISRSLINWTNIFGKLSDSHKIREEVLKVIEWVDKPKEELRKPILLLTGKAGCGKTIILQDVVKKLKEKGKCILAIKIDLIGVTNYNELKLKLNLSDDLMKIVNTITEKEMCVVIIDQIDSLSLVLSNDRSSINFYFDFINRISNIKNLRIIISCRDYDLTYDPLLRHLDQQSRISIGELHDEEVKSVTDMLDINYDQIPKVLKKLIANPQNLNIFCTIYGKNIDLDSIHTLQDLYNEFWIKKILSIPEKSGEYVQLLEKIAIEMSEDQKLNVPKLIYEDEFTSALNYLLSEGILKEERNQLQFFHQSFFEYCFSRAFVKGRKNISEYVLEQHQGLFARSTIKNVLSYLRGVNLESYNENLIVLLTSPKVRFHIKLLILNLLGSEENVLPSEWEIIKNKVLTNNKDVKYFIESICTIEWFYYLDKEGFIMKFLNSCDNLLSRSCEWMIEYRLIESNPGPILKFLFSLENNERNNSIVYYTILYLKEWDNPIALQLFDRVRDYFFSRNQYHLSKTLSRITKISPTYAIKILNELITKKISSSEFRQSVDRNIIGYEIGETFEILAKEEPVLFLEFALPLIKDISEKTRLLELEGYYIDNAFFLHEEFDNLKTHWGLIKLASQLLFDNAKTPKIFKKFFEEYKDDYALSILYVLTEGLLCDPVCYLDEVFYLLIRENLIKHCDLKSGLKYNILKLLNQTYAYFDGSRQEQINLVILKSEDLRIHKGDLRKYKGASIFALLSSIPLSERNKYSHIRRIYYELERKFGQFQNMKPKPAQISWVGPPIPETAYFNMQLVDWENSFKKYNDRTGWDKGYQNKKGFQYGGLIEHSRMFGRCIKEDPDKFFPFLLDLKKETTANEYFAEALRGLLACKYDYKKIKELVTYLINFNNDKFLRTVIIDCIKYIDEFEILEPFLFTKICVYSIDFEENNNLEPEESINDSLQKGINTLQGYAVFTLVTLKSCAYYKKQILGTLSKIANCNNISVKCAAIANLHHLVNLDPEKIYEIYKRCSNDLNDDILINSVYLLGYYINEKFNYLKNHLRAIVRIKGSDRVRERQNYVGQIVMYLYIKNVRGAKKLLEELYNDSIDFQAGLLKQAIYNIPHQNDTALKKAETIFKKLLLSESHIIQNEYTYAFREFKPEDFNKLYNYILLYSKNKSGKGNRTDNRIFEYLLQCVGYEPKKCLDVLENLLETSNFDLQESSISDEPVQILIGAYNKLLLYSKESYCEKAMDIFDKLLQIPELQFSVRKVLESADYS